jgi:GMP synthase-like glutamine amidotransferase
LIAHFWKCGIFHSALLIHGFSFYILLMRIHILQHIHFEGPVAIADWAARHGDRVLTTRLFDKDSPPEPDTFDMLVVMGGPMGVHDEEKFPWLRDEKACIRAAIDAGKSVVGVCLGAQLIADVLGARVQPGPAKEIGWFPLEFTDAARAPDAFPMLPERMTVFQWHGDTFDIPDGAVHLARSQAVPNQAFLYDGRVLALQFHMEVTSESVAALAHACVYDLEPGPCVQDIGQILDADPAVIDAMHTTLAAMLDRLRDTATQ